MAKKTVDDIATMRRRQQALELRKQGLTYREIGPKIGVSYRRAYELVSEALKDWAQPVIEELRELEGQRLDSAQAAVWPRVLAGEDQAIGSFLRISARRSALFGLDATTRVELTGGALDTLVRSLGLSAEEVASVIRESVATPSAPLMLDVTPLSAVESTGGAEAAEPVEAGRGPVYGDWEDA